MKFLAVFFLAFLSAGCQKIGGTAEQTVQAQNTEQPAVIKTCLPETNSQSSRIDTRKVPRIVHAEFVSGNKTWLATFNKEIYYTEDAGKNWKKLELQNADHFEAVNFLNEQFGWLADSNKNIWKTTDGGKSWNQIYTFKTAKEQKFLDIKEITFTSANNGWLRETFSVFRTTDGGKNWEKVNRLDGQPQKMFFKDDSHGWISFEENLPKSPLQILRTADGGKNWKKSNLPIGDSTASLYFTDERKGWFSDAFYGLLVTDDAGENWSKADLNTRDFQVKSVFWLNAAQGWFAGAVSRPDKSPLDAAANIPMILSTNDGGRSWNKWQMPNSELFFNEIHFADAANGWLVSKDAIYKTTDSGKIWKAVVKIDLSCS